MIFTDYSQHILKITASPVCTAIKTTSMASNYAFHFHRALKFRLCIFKNVPASGDFVPQTPCRGFAPGPHWGTSVPRFAPQLHLLDPPLRTDMHSTEQYRHSIVTAVSSASRVNFLEPAGNE